MFGHMAGMTNKYYTSPSQIRKRAKEEIIVLGWSLTLGQQTNTTTKPPKLLAYVTSVIPDRTNADDHNTGRANTNIFNTDADTMAKYITTWTQMDLDDDNLDDDRLGDNNSAPITPAPSTSAVSAPAPTASTPTAPTLTSRPEQNDTRARPPRNQDEETSASR